MRRPPEHTFHRRARNSRGGGGAGACACSTPAHSAQHPASYGGMIHAEAAFCHHLLQIPVAEAVAQVPPNAEDDDLILKVAPTEKFWPESNHWPSPYQITPPPFATEPAFDTDKKVRALQAADLVSWSVRRRLTGSKFNNGFETVPAVLEERHIEQPFEEGWMSEIATALRARRQRPSTPSLQGSQSVP